MDTQAGIFEVFKKNDVLVDGCVSVEKLKSVFEELGGKFTDEEFQTIFESADKDGKVNFAEFLEQLWDEADPAQKVSLEQTLQHIFDGMDRDGDGKVDVKELNQALCQSEEIQQLFNVKYSQSKGKGKGSAPPLPSFFKGAIEKFDLDGDGKISHQEFKDYFFPKLANQENSLQAWSSLYAAFHSIDEDGNGQITVAELNKALRESDDIQKLFNVEYLQSKGKGKGSAPPLPSFFTKIIDKFDTDGDGKISWSEFVTQLTTIPSTVSLEQTLQHIFDGMDRDGDGKVDIKELNQALCQSEEIQRLFNVKYSQSKGKGKGSAPPLPSFFKGAIEKFDMDGDGKISHQEFKDYFFPKLANQENSLEAWSSLYAAFHSIDEDGNGQITVAELNKALRESDDIQKLFNVEYLQSKGKGKGSAPPLPSFFTKTIDKFDTDGDGKISWSEFVTQLTSTAS